MGERTSDGPFRGCNALVGQWRSVPGILEMGNFECIKGCGYRKCVDFTAEMGFKWFWFWRELRLKIRMKWGRNGEGSFFGCVDDINVVMVLMTLMLSMLLIE